MTTTVTIEVSGVGVNFAKAGVIRNARTGRKLAATDPCATEEGAVRAAERLAEERGWTVVDADDDGEDV